MGPRCWAVRDQAPVEVPGTVALAWPGFALLDCPSCKGRMKLLAVVRNPMSIARYLAAAGEPIEAPGRSPSSPW